MHLYQHLDCDHLAQLLRAHRGTRGAALVVTESLFSMDGDAAPLAELRALCDRFDAGLYVDEAHALGTLGPQGRGLCAAAQVEPDLLVGTLGKAFGASGAFVAGPAATTRLIENRARSFVFSTAAPAALAAAVTAAADLVESADDRRQALALHVKRLHSGLAEQGYQVTPASLAPRARGSQPPTAEPDLGPSPIIPIRIGDPARTMEVSSALFAHGVFVHGVRPPTVPPGTSRLRVTAIATQTDAQIERALDAFAAVRRQLNLL